MEGDSGPKFVKLPDGRRVSYRELGCSSEEAKRSLLVLHGMGSSRLAAMPGVSLELLQEYGVRLVAIDRPGYGQSDPDPHQTLKSSAHDLEVVMDEAKLGEKVWLLGFSCGGAYCYAASMYIPHRIAGIALWCPIGNYWWKGVTQQEHEAMFTRLSRGCKTLIRVGSKLPFFVLRWYVRVMIVPMAGAHWVRNCQRELCLADRKHLQLPEAADLMLRDNTESLVPHGGFGMARDMHLVHRDWGFEVGDIGNVFKGPLHIWQGTDDNLVLVEMQHYVKKQLPDIVQLHELEGEGHLSWFCFNHDAHVQTLSTLFNH